jgi:hypothetical protein
MNSIYDLRLVRFTIFKKIEDYIIVTIKSIDK